MADSGSFRKPSALKHGAFSEIALFPWENAGDFDNLRCGLLEEFQPEGPLQEDCVNSIASCMWRKRRLQRKRQFDIAAELDRTENLVLWESPPPLFKTLEEKDNHEYGHLLDKAPPTDDYQHLLSFSSGLYEELHGQFLDLMIDLLPPEFSAHLNEKVPRKNFSSSRDWLLAIKREVDCVLLPMVRSRKTDAKGYFAAGSNFLSRDCIIEDLAIEERLDAHIDRAMKRLFQLKMARQLHANDQSKIVGARKISQVEHDPARPADRKTT